MVDVGEKAISSRRAVARCRVLMNPETAAAVRDGGMKKVTSLPWLVWRESKPRKRPATSFRYVIP